VGLKKVWIALSGQRGSLAPIPRALPSATMVQAFGLGRTGLNPSNREAGSVYTLPTWSLHSFISPQS
jgi:hypothetical protein